VDADPWRFSDKFGSVFGAFADKVGLIAPNTAGSAYKISAFSRYGFLSLSVSARCTPITSPAPFL
jgi:hypothetical protein